MPAPAVKDRKNSIKAAAEKDNPDGHRNSVANTSKNPFISRDSYLGGNQVPHGVNMAKDFRISINQLKTVANRRPLLMFSTESESVFRTKTPKREYIETEMKDYRELIQKLQYPQQQ